MHYIVLDLEWNQCPTGKENENSKIPFEIVEIGAVKLDFDLHEISSFSETIKPKVYKSLHYKMREISKITMEELQNSRDFERVVLDFLKWCGKEYTFCTWGSIDLSELQRNMQFYHIKKRLDFPLRYYDIQKLFSIDKEDGKLRRALSTAAEMVDLDEDNKFHRALNDARYTAELMRHMNFNLVKSFYSIDCYYVPRAKKDEIYARFLTYTKYISRKFTSKEKALKDKEVVSVKCCKCDKKMKVILPWFSDNAKYYYAIGFCEEHGFMKCKIKMKKVLEDQVFVIKVTRPINREDIQEIVDKQHLIREKRKIKRNKGGSGKADGSDIPGTSSKSIDKEDGSPDYS